MNIKKTIQTLKDNKVLCSVGDTVYGLHALVNENTSAYIRKIKKKKDNKFILLYTCIKQVSRFIQWEKMRDEYMEDILYPHTTATTYIVPGVDSIVTYDRAIAIRLVALKSPIYKIINALNAPLLSTSCNIAGSPCATNITEAFKYFGGRVAYVNTKQQPTLKPSRVIDMRNLKKIR